MRNDAETMRNCKHSFTRLYPRCKECGFDAIRHRHIFTKEDRKKQSKCKHVWKKFRWETGSYYASDYNKCFVCTKCYKKRRGDYSEIIWFTFILLLASIAVIILFNTL